MIHDDDLVRSGLVCYSHISFEFLNDEYNDDSNDEYNDDSNMSYHGEKGNVEGIAEANEAV
jgi:hypothetical protein